MYGGPPLEGRAGQETVVVLLEEGGEAGVVGRGVPRAVHDENVGFGQLPVRIWWGAMWATGMKSRDELDA